MVDVLAKKILRFGDPESRYPVSLDKIMTLYVLLEETAVVSAFKRMRYPERLELRARSGMRPRHFQRGRLAQILVVSASVSASSMSTPRYRTVFSILAWPSRI